MSNELYYLKPNVVVEPLVDKWYAWAHLLSPATLCMNIKNRHLKIMKSYIMAPQAHAAAVKDPKMLGGPFIDYQGQRVSEIRAMLNNTETECRLLIDFAKAIEELEKLLVVEAKGFSLEPLYPKVPDLLRGYVELVYDLNNHAGIRFKEALLYHSELNNTSIQSLSMSLMEDDDRPFVFSTPRLPTEKSLHLSIPFKDEIIDEIFKMERNAAPLEPIVKKLNIQGKDMNLFKSFFTQDVPRPYNDYVDDHIRIRYFGHACILIETMGKVILVDPVLSYTYESDVSRYTYQDIPEKIDFVLITHNHQDHILIETLLRIRHKIGRIVVPSSGSGSLQDPNLRLMLTNIGFKNVVELQDLEELPIPNGTITGLPFIGEHGDLDIKAKTGYLVKIGHYKIMLLADSNNIEPRMYEHLQKIYGSIDVIFIGMECDGAPLSWLYGPYLPNELERSKDSTRRFSGSNYERAIDLVNRFSCKEIYVYAMGMEPWVKFLTSVKYTDESNPIIQSNKLIQECQQRGIVAERLFGEKEILRVGETV